MLYDERVCLRVIFIVVDTVHYADKTVRLGVHQAIESLTVERHPDLVCVGITYGRHIVRIDNTAL